MDSEVRRSRTPGSLGTSINTYADVKEPKYRSPGEFLQVGVEEQRPERSRSCALGEYSDLQMV